MKGVEADSISKAYFWLSFEIEVYADSKLICYSIHVLSLSKLFPFITTQPQTQIQFLHANSVRELTWKCTEEFLNSFANSFNWIYCEYLECTLIVCVCMRPDAHKYLLRIFKNLIRERSRTFLLTESKKLARNKCMLMKKLK